MIKEKRKREIVIQAFLMTGYDEPDSLFEYINLLEKSVLRMHKKLTKRKKAIPRIRIEEAIYGEYE